MKWTFIIQQKLKVAMLLGVVMAVVVVFNFLLQKSITDINRSVNSLYNDRLIPATDMFHLSEVLHNRQLFVEELLYQHHEKLNLVLLLQQYDNKMYKLIDKYEKTYLVEEELTFLNRFKQKVADYKLVENKIIALYGQHRAAEALVLYTASGKPALDNTIKQLSDLTTIQSAVGRKLVSDSQGIVAMSNFLSHLQLVLAIVIGVIITNLVVSSKVINQPQAKFKWN